MRTMYAFSILVLSLTIAPLAAAQDFDHAGEQAMLEQLNALRAENHLAPLGRTAELDATARAHAVDMASRNDLGHVSPTSGTPEDRVRRAGIPARTIAENVAMHRDTLSAYRALLASPPHLGNLLSADVTHIGLGSVRTAQGVYVTQLFAGLPPEPPPALVAAPPAAEAAPAPLAEAPLAEAPAAPPLAPNAAEATPEAEEDAIAEEIEEEEPVSLFALIPPFIEQVLGTAAAPSPARSPASEERAGTPPARAAQPLPPATAAALRQLVDLAQSLLGAPQAP